MPRLGFGWPKAPAGRAVHLAGNHWYYCSMKNEIRVGIVGAGANTRERHIPGLRAIPGVKIVGVSNRTPSSSGRAAEALAIPKPYATWKELVGADEIDAIVIGTWPYLHAPVTLAAIEAGKHVLCEARMAMSSREAREMLSASRLRPDLVCQIVPSPMTLEVDATVERLIREGTFGRLISVEVNIRSGQFPAAESPLAWRQNEEYSGHNAMALGIWYEAVARWVGHAVSVQAVGQTVVPLRPDPERGGSPKVTRIPDQLYIICEMAFGGTACFAISTVLGGEASEQVVLYGSDATLTLRSGHLELRRRGASGPEEIPVQHDSQGGWRVEEDFIRSIREGAPILLTSFEEGVRYMELTDAVWMSMAEGRRIGLPLIMP